MKLQALLPFAFLTAAAAAQDQPPFPIEAPWQGVAVDTEPAADGAFWCRGHRYKMRFSEAGAGFMPLFGPNVRENPLLGFTLDDHPVTAVRMRDDGCDLARGTIVERWNLTGEHAEQTFLLAAPPAGGTLRIPVTSSLPEFAFRAADAAGLHFAADGLGEVLYAPAFAIAGDGARTPLATTWRNGTIEIVLPTDAAYPLTIDPVVSTLPVAVGEPGNDMQPDVSYDASSGRWIVVWQQRLSAFDSDVLFRRFSATGALIGTGSAETSGAVAEAPSVGNCSSSNNFFVAWRESIGHVRGRRITASTGGMGAIETVYNAIVSAPAEDITVGGSSASGFMVTYTVDNVATLPRVNASLVPATPGTINSTIVYTGIFCTVAHVGTATGTPEHWVVVGHETALGCLVGIVRFAILDANLNILAGPTSVAGTALSGDLHPHAASNGTDVVLLWTRTQTTGGAFQRQYAQTMRRVSGGYVVTNPSFDISSLEPGTSAGGAYRNSDIASDGARFCYAYEEDGIDAPRFATFGIVNGALQFYEGHTSVGGTAIAKTVSGLASQGESGGPATRFLLVSQMANASSQFDIEGTFLDAFQPGTRISMVQTGCHALGVPEPVVTTTGDSLLGSTLTVSVAGTVGVPFMLVGLPLTQPLSLCGNFHLGTCRQGVQLPTLATALGNQMVVPMPRDASYVGLDLAIQCVDALAGACPTSLFGAPFAVTDTVTFTVR